MAPVSLVPLFWVDSDGVSAIESGAPVTFFINGHAAEVYEVGKGPWMGSYPFIPGGETNLNLRVGPHTDSDNRNTDTDPNNGDPNANSNNRNTDADHNNGDPNTNSDNRNTDADHDNCDPNTNSDNRNTDYTTHYSSYHGYSVLALHH